MVVAQDGVPAHRVEGIIWEAVPIQSLVRLEEALCPMNCVRASSPSICVQSLLPSRHKKHSLSLDAQRLDRGTKLFRYVVAAVNRGESVGISYGRFLAYLHGARSFRELAGRNFCRPTVTRRFESLGN